MDPRPPGAAVPTVGSRWGLGHCSRPPARPDGEGNCWEVTPPPAPPPPRTGCCGDQSQSVGVFSEVPGSPSERTRRPSGNFPGTTGARGGECFISRMGSPQGSGLLPLGPDPLLPRPCPAWEDMRFLGSGLLGQQDSRAGTSPARPWATDLGQAGRGRTGRPRPPIARLPGRASLGAASVWGAW